MVILFSYSTFRNIVCDMQMWGSFFFFFWLLKIIRKKGNNQLKQAKLNESEMDGKGEAHTHKNTKKMS